MKTKFTIKSTTTLRIVFVLCMISSFSGYSQVCSGNQITITVENISTPTDRTLEFDIYVSNTGSTSLQLAAIQGSVIYNNGLLPAGATGTFTCITQPTATGNFPNFNATAPTHTLSSRQLRWTHTFVNLASGNTVTLPANTALKFARFKFTSTLPWTTSFPGTLSLRYIVGGGYTNVLGTVYCEGNTNSTGLGSATLGTLVVGGPYNIDLNPCGPGTTKTYSAGAWTPSEPTENDPAIIASNFTSTGDITACSLTVNTNAVVLVKTGHNFNIANAVTVATGSSLTFENNANLIQTNNSSVNSGIITIKRDSNALLRLDYTLWSSPVLGQNLLTFSPLTLVTPSSRFYTYNPNLSTSGLYSAVTNPAATNFALGTGYLIRMPNTTSALTPTKYNGEFTGVPNNGIITVPVTAGLDSKYNAVGNPYPSRINAATFKAANPDITTLYYWRKTNNINQGSLPTPSYATYNIASNTGIGVTPDGVATGQPTIVPDANIQVGQGFLVSTAQSSVVFNNGMRLFTAGDQILKTKAVETDRIWLNLSNPSWPINQMALCYIDGASQDVDETDSRYFNDSQTALNSLINNEEFVIQGRSLPFDPQDIVPLAFKTTADGNFTIAIDHVEGIFSGNQDIFLKDNNTGIETDLKAGPYNFTALAGVDNARFSLKYQKTLKVNSSIFDENSITIYKNKGIITIKSENTLIDIVQLFDIRGRLVFEKDKINATTTTIESAKFANQVLIAKITSDVNIVVTKKIVN